MTYNILLYGATGFAGRLISSEMMRSNEVLSGAYRMILAGRDTEKLKERARKCDMAFRVFGLDDRRDVERGLRGIDVVLNAAGPFAWTAERLAKVAVEMDCHYVDINGEADVYRRLDDLDLTQRPVSMICAAGFWSAASDWLLDEALPTLPKGADPTAVRIVMSRIVTFSRGSVETVWRSLREQVMVVRKGDVDVGRGVKRPELVLWHEPVGKLERLFDFRARDEHEADWRVASAASLVDTLTARLTLKRHGVLPRVVESYVEMSPARRTAYQIGSMLAPVAAFAAVRGVVAQGIELLEEGPSKAERDAERHVILLQVEDLALDCPVDWRWETPNVYQFTAQLALGVARAVASASDLSGWRTPSEALRRLDRDSRNWVLRGCDLYKREP